ncbi:MAG: hypothetical protein KBA66_20070 [Leptospiraceae bacterium]|nr:hypothetical protein [Leptospiraceae bacterium]
MGYNNRKSIRLKEYNYAAGNFYYITICVKNKRSDFGKIQSDNIELSDIGEIADLFWREIPLHFRNAILDEHIIMPNHLHGIIELVEYIQPAEQQNKSTFQHIQKNSIPSIIRSYKAAVTKWCNQNNFENFQWQRNYYEHIIRTEEDYFRIKHYIETNPKNWSEDEHYK